MSNGDRRRAAGQVGKLLDGVRRTLVDTGARNRLVHVNRASQRTAALNISRERSASVFQILRVDTKRMRFKATGNDAGDDPDDLHLAPAEEEADDAARHRDLILETPLGPEALQRKLLKLFTNARTAEEEQGVNTLYLALGFLTWFEATASHVARQAPLILLPVELVRSERGGSFTLRCRDDDVVTNLPLQERLKDDFGIVLPDIDDAEEWAPAEYFAAVAQAVSGRPRWSIDEDGIQLGFFSFAKLLMHRDLDPDNWPGATLADNALVKRLMHDGFAPQAPLFEPGENLDARLQPADIIQVVDADASQTRVIQEVRDGRHLVVQGPPGTGKSQSITNIIAAAVHDGKTVLFMAEKMAALEVVHKRLVNAGLRDICLNLHSRDASKKAVLHELGHTLDAGRRIPETPDAPHDLRRCRDELNRIADLLHENVPDRDYSPFSAMAEMSGLLGRGTPAPSLPADRLHLLTDADRDRLVRAIQAYVGLLDAAGRPAEHPFAGVRALDLQPPERQRLAVQLAEACAAITAALETGAGIAARLAKPPPTTLGDLQGLMRLLERAAEAPAGVDRTARIFLDRRGEAAVGEALAAGRAWRLAHDACADTFVEAAWTASLSTLRAAIAKGVGSFWSRQLGGYRGASRQLATLLTVPLPAAPVERLALLTRLILVQRRRAALAADEALLAEALGTYWRGERTDFAHLATACAWVQAVVATDATVTHETVVALVALGDAASRRRAELAEAHGEAELASTSVLDRLELSVGAEDGLADEPLAPLRRRLERMQAEIGRYHEWCRLATQAGTLADAGLGSLVEALATGELVPTDALDEFLYAVAEARWAEARRTLPGLDRLARQDRHELVEKFKSLDRQWIEAVRQLIRARHLEQLPKGAAGEMGFIRGEIAKQRRHKPIRTLMARAGQMVRRIKPVFLMSPISIAQFLPPGAMTFDLLVIDEASQVRPEDALGAVARARQIVVVGDQKQLPPTSFFDRLTSNHPDDDDQDDDEAEAAAGVIPGTAKVTEMESILTLCEARGLNARMFEWHYRSRDPSLIRVSNAEFYNDRLILPPSPLQNDADYGLKFTRVAGVYSSRHRGGGRPGTNRIEAERIAAALAAHAGRWPTLSAGVVAFSKTQRDMITEVLEVHRRTDAVLDTFLHEGKAEALFVKNIENVQGDERDVIFISVGYGPHQPDGRLASMNFGPVNGEGGERRLNVLFSRARMRCEVFASFDPDDIDLARTSRDGPRVLKRFLKFAKTGKLDQRLVSGGGADSAFEEDVAQVITSLGYHADAQVGSAGFRIDIGVRPPERPGRYILAVECDGATWHRALSARERDRLRQEVLEGLGWRFHRIWSTDWFQRRGPEIARLREALDEAKTAPNDDAVGAGMGEPPPAPVTAETASPVDFSSILESSLKAPAYRKAMLPDRNGREPHELPARDMAELVVRVVEQEGPIHTDEVARRIAAAFGKSRTGGGIRKAVHGGLLHAARHDGLLKSGEFWLTAAQRDDAPVRDRSGEGVPTNKAEYLSPLEIQAAARMIEAESGAVGKEEMVAAVARLLGYSRTGRDLRQVIVAGLGGAEDAGPDR